MYERIDNMKNILIKSVSIVLTLAMLLGVMSVSTFATTEGEVAESVDVKINDINNNVVNIYASAEKEAIVALASYKNNVIVN